MYKPFAFLPPYAKSIFFSGICGVSMSSLAIISAMRGYTVSGSDSCADPKRSELLKEQGIRITHYHDTWNSLGYDVLVRTEAVSEDNPDVITARRAGIPVYSRSEFLGGILSEYPERTGIAGTHGKSTVGGMTASILSSSSAIIGASSIDLGGSFRISSPNHVIYEACEYKRSFLDMPPTEAVVLNIEKEHTDCFASVSDSVNAYADFIKNARSCVLSCDDLNVMKLAPYAQNAVFFSARDEKADLYAKNICETRGYYSFEAVLNGKPIFKAALAVPGYHNLKNALAASLTALHLGAEPETVKNGLEGFHGMKRRLEKLGSFEGADIYDDYAHHPTEIRSSLSALRRMGYKKIICAFQPHTYSRTVSLFEEFTHAFEKADTVIFADIFAARERNIYGISSADLARATENGIYIPKYGDIISYLAKHAEKDCALVTLGAGELNTVAEKLASL